VGDGACVGACVGAGGGVGAGADVGGWGCSYSGGGMFGRVLGAPQAAIVKRTSKQRFGMGWAPCYP
jgi:hypothetical protein